MKHFEIDAGGVLIPAVSADAVVVGSGAAGWAAADWLHDFGVHDLILATENIQAGASRNTGSDKQTYHKLALASDEPDSVAELAADLFACGGMHGDLALTMAACSARCFHKLVNLGIPFPENVYGEHVGYRTDHDPKRRATSAGPLTSRYMTEALEAQVRAKAVAVLDQITAFRLIVDQGRTAGILCIHRGLTHTPSRGLYALFAPHILLATGGPAACYARSVYPESQAGMSGLALEAGARHVNLNEWQYGLASTTFRWNVSGTYQQVLPRYISVDADGREHEFLNESYTSPEDALNAVFRKGYEWPFDAARAEGSSRIDALVHREIVERGRRVFLDFRTDPLGLVKGFDKLSKEAYDYLDQSGALVETPIRRLHAMNPESIALYASHGIDLASEPLEVAVCAQHLNGGIDVDIHWCTSIPGLYAAGEVAGTFGARRPGGSALAAGQIGALRAAEHIAASVRSGASLPEGAVSRMAEEAAQARAFLESALMGAAGKPSIASYLRETQQEMSACAAHMRSLPRLRTLASRCATRAAEIARAVSLSVPEELVELVKARDTLITQQAVLQAMAQAAPAGSHGGAILRDNCADLLPDPTWDSLRLITQASPEGFDSYTEPVRPIPEPDNWFETVWRAYRAGG